jgi:hypothetical protein
MPLRFDLQATEEFSFVVEKRELSFQAKEQKPPLRGWLVYFHKMYFGD